MKRKLLLLLTIFTCTISFAQIEVSGIVEDEKGNSLPGVSVHVKGTTMGTITGSDGKYHIRVPNQETVLVFSFVGYLKEEVKVGVQNAINIKLLPDLVNVDEVVVVGFGTQKKVSVVAAISTVNTKELVQSPAANLSNALAGRLTGLITVQNTGQPGKDDASLYIRGRSTWINASPLVIVDGVERASFTQVDANEVESISILKDASATAVYGVRGANGVIIITTKRGTEQKPVVSLSAQTGLQRPTRLPDFLNSYESALLKNESYLNDGYTVDQLPFDQSALEAFRTHSDPYHYPDVNWYDVLLRKTAPQSQYNINIRGGTKTARYFLSTGYLFQDGLFNTPKHDYYTTNFNYKRFNFRSNLDLDVTKSLILSVNIAVRTEDTNEPGSTGYPTAELRTGFASLISTAPYETPLYQSNGKPGMGPLNKNPYWDVNGSGFTINRKDVVESSFVLDQKLDRLTKGLSAKALFSYDSYYSDQSKFYEQKAYYRLESLPGEEDRYFVYREDQKLRSDNGYTASYNSAKTYAEGALNYDHDFGNNDVTVLLLGNLQSLKDGGGIPRRTMGIVTRLTYGYAQKYLAEFDMGYNGSESFARGKRFGLFPSLSAGWVISNENFFKNGTAVVNFMKIRFSYGLVGNDKIGEGRFLYNEQYSTRNSWDGLGLPEFGVSPSEHQVIALSRIANPNLTWEKANKYNVGLETHFFENKITSSIDVFHEYRWDILMERSSIPYYLGVNNPAGNLGETKNSGCDIEVKYRNRIGGEFNYWVNANHSYSKNTILAKDEPANKLEWQKESGHSIGQFFGYHVLGFYDITDYDENGDLDPAYPRQLVGQAPQPGDFKYEDVSGDGIVDERDKVAIGYSDVPRGFYGFSYGVSWKGLDFSMMWQGAYHVSLKISGETIYEFYEGGKVQNLHKGRWAYYTDPFTGELIDTRATATYPRLHGHGSSPNWTTNDFFLYNSSYVKLRNVEIGYELNVKQLKYMGIKKMRMYANANNLLSFSKVEQVDPEGPGYGSDKERGFNYPQLSIYNVGINVTF